MQAVETKIRENRRFMITTLPDVSRSVVYKIVTDNLNFKKLVLGGYPDYSHRNKKRERFAISFDFFNRYEEERDDMLSRIVTGDETWIPYITPESKQQSMKWQHTSSPVKVKAKRCQSARLWQQCSETGAVFC
ncbi:uncharacterized protein TNCV_5104611 [Trichonephila clavipes]|nr:uncharacterized protein TNCV_5104611 [Trichonephila clavipes]